jgi:hypothetical protein
MCSDQAADLHTPEELLYGARALAAVGGPHFNRGAILEAIAALETYVGALVFKLLEDKIDPLLVRYVKEKTQRDFDSRLSVLVPAATQLPIGKSDALWLKYKRAKEIRNRVTHAGRKVTAGEVEEVLSTVYDWLAYLGYTANIDQALLELRDDLEKHAAEMRRLSAPQLEAWIANHFSRSRPAGGSALSGQSIGGDRQFDALLQFGKNKVAIDIKLSEGSAADFNHRIRAWTTHFRRRPQDASIDRFVVVWITREKRPASNPSLLKEEEGRLTVLPVFIG